MIYKKSKKDIENLTLVKQKKFIFSKNNFVLFYYR